MICKLDRNYGRQLAVRFFIKVEAFNPFMPHLKCLPKGDERPKYHYRHVNPNSQHTKLQVKDIGKLVESKKPQHIAGASQFWFV